jgi:hypothetical protein
MMGRSSLLASFTISLALCALPAGAEPPASQPTEAQIEQAIKRLDSPAWQEREDAGEWLRRAGKTAIPALQRLAKSCPPEAAARAQQILDDFKWGLLPDTPAEIVKLVRDFRQADPNADQSSLINQLIDKGADGMRAIQGILQAEDNENARRAITECLQRRYAEIVPQLIYKGELGEAERMLSLAAEIGEVNACRHYAAFLLVSGKLDAEIKQLQSEIDSGEIVLNPMRIRLAMMYRAKGDLDAAIKTVPASADSYENLLLEAGVARIGQQPASSLGR